MVMLLLSGEGINSEAFNLSKLNGYDSERNPNSYCHKQSIPGLTTNPKDSLPITPFNRLCSRI